LINNQEVRFKYLGSRHYLDSLLGVNQALMAEAEQHAAVGSAMTEFHYATHLKTLGNTCRSLYDLLLGKWGELPERLMIIPDDRLFTLNFDILLTDRPEPGAPLYKWPFAIRNHVFSYNHSIANWLELTGKSQVKRKVIGIAPAIQEPYAPLKYSQAGLEQIQGFNLKLLSGPAANRSQIEALGRNTILDFQTHAVISDRQNSYSFILLNTVEGSLDSLYLKDIYHFKLPGTFVILTACETHVGDIARGEGVISIARAFTYAGASGMITSLWKVDDYTSSLLMEHFYGYLGQGDQIDIALRNAKLDLLDNAQDERAEHPFYWASLIHIGNASAIASTNRTWILATFSIVGLILFVVVIRFLLKRILLKRKSAPGAVEPF
jgi:CHAT domain-containing protein